MQIHGAYSAPTSHRHRTHMPEHKHIHPRAKDGTFFTSPAMEDDGNELHFCSTCAFSQVCLAEGYDKNDLQDLHVLVSHIGPFQPGEHIFTQGNRFNAIAAVRAGMVKTYTHDAHGREKILGFHLPGEIIGLNGIENNTYPCHAIAVDTVMTCHFTFEKMAILAAKIPTIQKKLFKLLSADINHAQHLAGDYSANEKMAAFLLSLSNRYAQRGFSAQTLPLAMSRVDIANHLSIAPETVSRVFKRLQEKQVIKVHRHHIEFIERGTLQDMVSDIQTTHTKPSTP